MAHCVWWHDSVNGSGGGGCGGFFFRSVAHFGCLTGSLCYTKKHTSIDHPHVAYIHIQHAAANISCLYIYLKIWSILCAVCCVLYIHVALAYIMY